MSVTVSKFGNFIDIPQSVQDAIDASVAIATSDAIKNPSGTSINNGVPRFVGVDGSEVEASNVRIDAFDDLSIPGTLTMGVGGTNYILPNTRGGAGEVPTDVLGDGNITWELGGGGNPFDQDLNTTDSVQFANITLEPNSRVEWDGQQTYIEDTATRLSIISQTKDIRILSADRLFLESINDIEYRTFGGDHVFYLGDIRLNTAVNLILSPSGNIKWDSSTSQITNELNNLDISGQDDAQIIAKNGIMTVRSDNGPVIVSSLTGSVGINANSFISLQTTSGEIQLSPNLGTGGIVRVLGQIEVGETGTPFAEHYFLPNTRLGSLNGDTLILNSTTGELEFKQPAPFADQNVNTTDSVQFVNITATGDIIANGDITLDALKKIDWNGKPTQFIKDNAGFLDISGQDALQIRSRNGLLDCRSENGAVQITSSTGNVGITALNQASIETTNLDIELTPQGGSGSVVVSGNLDVTGPLASGQTLSFNKSIDPSNWTFTHLPTGQLGLADQTDIYLLLDHGKTFGVFGGSVGAGYDLVNTKPIGEDFVMASTDALGNMEWRLRNDPKEYGELYFFGNALTTPFVDQVTFIKVAATYTTGLITAFGQGAGPDAGRLQYSGNGGIFKIDVSLSVLKVGGANDYEFAVFQNGVVIDKTRMNRNVASAVGVEPVSLSMTCLLNIATADYIDVRVRNNDNTEAATIIDMNINITQV